MREMVIYHNVFIYVYLLIYLLFNKLIIICDQILTPLGFERGEEYEVELPATRGRLSGFHVFTKLKLRD